MKENNKKAIDLFMQDAIKHITTSGESYYVGVVESALGQSSVLVDIIKRLTADKCGQQLPILLLSISPNKKVAINAKVPSSILSSKSLTANKWANEVALACSGKGGGKDDTAAGSGNDPSKIGEAIERANTYAKQNL